MPAVDTDPVRAHRPRVLSGIQPTADSFHLGNYLGAVQYWVSLQDDHDAFYCVVDLHAITVATDPALLRQRTRVAAAQLLAAGLDTERCKLFCQSHIAEHAELAWVLGCITGYGEAARMTQFKDKSTRQGNDGTTVGLFTYPVLMAADILLYQADRVPVGEDQRQHLELTRDLAVRFNHRFGETFVVPNPHIVKETAKIYDLAEPDVKMSKTASSPSGIIELLEDPKQAVKKIRSAVTDSGREVTFEPETKPGVANLLSIHAALTGQSVEASTKQYGGGGYGDLKKGVAEVVSDFMSAFQQRYAEFAGDPAELDRLLADGAAAAREVATATLDSAYDRVGLLPRVRQVHDRNISSL